LIVGLTLNGNPMKPPLHRIFRFSYIGDCPRVDYRSVPAMLDAAGCESHITDCNVPYETDILLSFEIPAREVVENHLDAYLVLAVQDDFSVLPDCFHI